MNQRSAELIMNCEAIDEAKASQILNTQKLKNLKTQKT